jgi:hypothetical protein
MMIRTLTQAAVLLSLSAAAWAGPADDANNHLKAIAAGNVEQIMQGYADTAALQWVGGPLDGAYMGHDKLAEVWGKFAKGNAPLELTVNKLEESTNAKGTTVTANVEFKGKNMIKVRYVLVYRDGKLVNEVWQIDPKLMMSY